MEKSLNQKEQNTIKQWIKYWLISSGYALLSFKFWYSSYKASKKTGEWHKYKLLIALVLALLGWVFFWAGIFVR